MAALRQFWGLLTPGKPWPQMDKRRISQGAKTNSPTFARSERGLFISKQETV